MKLVNKLYISLLAPAFLLAASGAYAQETPTAAPAGVKIVGAKEVQELQAKGVLLQRQ